MFFNGWFIALIVLWILGLGVHLGNHGKPKKEKYNFWGALIGLALNFWLTYMAIITGF